MIGSFAYLSSARHVIDLSAKPIGNLNASVELR